MEPSPEGFAAWLEQAEVSLERLTQQQQAVLLAAFRFRQRLGTDYYSNRLLSHFLLHCDCGLKVAQIARLAGFSRPTVSTHQGLPSKTVIQQAHHRMDGRPHGKLLPRYAGAIASFLVEHPSATRAELIDFIAATFGVRVSRVALHKFLKKFGLAHLPGPLPPNPTQSAASSAVDSPAVTDATPSPQPPPLPPTPAAEQPFQAVSADAQTQPAAPQTAPPPPAQTAAEPQPSATASPPPEPPSPSCSAVLTPVATMPSPASRTPPAATGRLFPATVAVLGSTTGRTVLLPAPGQPQFLGTTQYAGAFLLLGNALDWLEPARHCLSDEFGLLTRGFLTSVFAPVVGLERMFHLDEMEDKGFAILTGGQRCPSRYSVGAWRRHLPWCEVDAFCRRSSPWHLLHDEQSIVSYDEHTIPRWTHKFSIRKGYVTTRNKHMRCEKLFYSYDVNKERYLAVRATPGDRRLIDLAVPLTRQTLLQGQANHVHAIFDAGAGQADAGIRLLWDLARDNHPRLDVTVRAVRQTQRMKQWKSLPREEFVSYQEPGRYVGAADKEIRVAETTTVLKDESEEQAVRTLICREVVPGPKKDRWHPLYTTMERPLALPYEVLEEFRLRQHHEQAYRVGKYDEFLDAVPCGYDKDSPNPKRPRWQLGGMQMMGWLAALVFNAVADLAEELEGDYTGCHIRTLRRTFFNRPGTMYQTPQALIVSLDPFAGQEALTPVVDQFNAAGHCLPWLANRQVVLSLTPSTRQPP